LTASTDQLIQSSPSNTAPGQAGKIVLEDAELGQLRIFLQSRAIEKAHFTATAIKRLLDFRAESNKLVEQFPSVAIASQCSFAPSFAILTITFLGVLLAQYSAGPAEYGVVVFIFAGLVFLLGFWVLLQSESYKVLVWSWKYRGLIN